jgi:glc operon protein GlcG
MKALQAGLAKAEELGIQVAIAIVDDHADPVAAVRMTDVRFLFLPQAAQGKAMASVVWGQPSGALNERGGTPMMQATNNVYHGQLFYQQGAVPVKKDGKVIGAVGTGGASPQQDEEVSMAAAAVLGEV